MKKRALAWLMACLLLLSSCAKPEREDNVTRIVATTYPVYLFTAAITRGLAGVEVSLMVSQPTSCLHDYTLTVSDMKAIERADVIVMNGAGLEDFMADALKQSGGEIIDASAGIDLLPAEGHEGHDGHDHEEEYDPHYWLDPGRAIGMAQNIKEGLIAYGTGDPQMLRANESGVEQLLGDLPDKLREQIGDVSALSNRELITFHDGFRYFADYLGLHILKSIEEEAGSEASAKEIVAVTNLIKTHGIPAIFTEVNGSQATAKAVQRETGVKIYTLNMLMSGEGVGLQPYLDGIYANVRTILEALG